MEKRIWILYDGRAAGGDTDDAAVLEAWGPRKGKPDMRHWHDHDAALYSYRQGPNHTAEDERREEFP